MDEVNQILIRMLDGQTVPLEVGSSETVEHVKTRIEYQTQIPVHQQRLLFASQQLEDNRTLSSYNIRNNAELHLVMRLRGGLNLRTL